MVAARRGVVAQAEKFSRGLTATFFTLAVAVGAITGAVLKGDKQKAEAIQGFRELSPAARIGLLQTQRDNLLQQRAAIDRKLEAFEEQVKERQRERERERERIARERNTPS